MGVYPTFESEAKRREYFDIIANINNSVANMGFYGALSDYVDCSAQASAGDMVREGVCSNEEEMWQAAIDTATSILDCWQEYYPELIKS